MANTSPSTDAARSFWTAQFLAAALEAENEAAGHYQARKLPLRRLSGVLEILGALLLAIWIGLFTVFGVFATLNRYFHVGAG